MGVASLQSPPWVEIVAIPVFGGVSDLSGGSNKVTLESIIADSALC